MSTDTTTEQAVHAVQATTAPVEGAPAPRKLSPLWARYGMNPKAVSEGTWHPCDGGLELCMRSQADVTVKRAANRINAECRQQILDGNGVLDPVLQAENEARLLADAVVLDWRGATDPEGNELPCTHENVLALFGHPAMAELRAEALDKSASRAEYRLRSVDGLEGNYAARFGAASRPLRALPPSSTNTSASSAGATA